MIENRGLSYGGKSGGDLVDPFALFFINVFDDGFDYYPFLVTYILI